MPQKTISLDGAQLDTPGEFSLEGAQIAKEEEPKSQSSPLDIATGFERRAVGAVKGVGALASGVAGAYGLGVQNPAEGAYNLVMGLARPNVDQYHKAEEAVTQGRPWAAAGHSAAAAIPILGPQVADLVERAPQDPYGVAGEALFDAATMAAPSALGKISPKWLRESATGNYAKAMHPVGKVERTLAEKGAAPFVEEGRVIPTLKSYATRNEKDLHDLGIERQNLKSSYPTSELELPSEPIFEELDKTAKMRHADPSTGQVARGTPKEDAMAKSREQIANVEERSALTGKKKGQEVVLSMNRTNRPVAFRDPVTGVETDPTVFWDSLDDLKTTLQDMARKGYIDQDLLAERGAKQGAKTTADTLMGILDEATPDIAAVNKKMSPRLDAKAVLEQAMDRAQGIDTGIGHGALMTGGTGIMGRIGRSIIYSKGLSNTRQLLGSTGFRTLRGAAKVALAKAIESGDTGMVESMATGLLNELAQGSGARPGERAPL